MIITQTQLALTRKKAVLSTEIKNGVTDEVLYFAVDRKYASLIAKDASVFLAAMHLPMAKMGQPISMDTAVSGRLVKELKTANRVVRRRSRHFGTARIVAPVLTTDRTGKFRACFFTGDEKSCRLFLKRFKVSQKITHLIFVAGFNGAYGDSALVQRIGKIAHAQNIKLIVVRTNIRDVTDPIADWNFVSVGVLAAVGFFLRRGFKRILVPSLTRKTYSVLDAGWISETLDGLKAPRVYPKTLIWKVRAYIRDLDARFLRFRLYRFLARSGIIRRQQPALL